MNFPRCVLHVHIRNTSELYSKRCDRQIEHNADFHTSTMPEHSGNAKPMQRRISSEYRTKAFPVDDFAWRTNLFLIGKTMALHSYRFLVSIPFIWALYYAIIWATGIAVASVVTSNEVSVRHWFGVRYGCFDARIAWCELSNCAAIGAQHITLTALRHTHTHTYEMVHVHTTVAPFEHSESHENHHTSHDLQYALQPQSTCQHAGAVWLLLFLFLFFHFIYFWLCFSMRYPGTPTPRRELILI